MASDSEEDVLPLKEGFYLTTHSTHLVTVIWRRHMVTDHSYNERGNPLPPQWATLFD